jgi:amino acid adenylation domain-containing protein
MHELLSELHRRGIRLQLADGRLKVLAPPDALTVELREQLKLRREDLIEVLGRSVTGGDQPVITADPEHRHDPYPLTDIQHAYWVGRSSAVELGGVFTHTYFELDRADQPLEPDRLTQSLNRVIARHDMLRAIVQRNGEQRVLPEVRPYRIALRDLRGSTEPERTAELAKIRDEMSHQAPSPDRWPLFEFRATRIDENRFRLHVNVANLIIDWGSLAVLFHDWQQLYEDPAAALEPLELTFRDVVLAERARRDSGQDAAAERYWLDRIDELPAGPALPLAVQPSQIEHPVFSVRRARLCAERWTALKLTARRNGVTPSAVVLTAFCDVLRRWSEQPSFTLDLTLFNRPSWDPRIAQMIGDFTSVTLLAVEPADTFAARAGQVNRQLLRDLEHNAFSGVRVLQERSRRLGGGPGASMPVVFTSGLVLDAQPDDVDEAGASRAFFGEFQYSICETPQVWLDCQVAEDHGDLLLDWDAVDELFPAGLLDDMFAAYAGLLDRLSTDPDLWQAAKPLLALPEWQAAERAAANATAARIAECTLSELVVRTVAAQPDAVAVIAADGQASYAELLARAYRLAQQLDGESGLIAVVLPRGVEQVAAVLAVTLTTAAYLPIDPEWPPGRRFQLLAQGEVATVITSAQLRDEAPWPTGLRLVTFDDQAVRDAPAEPPATAPAPTDLAYVIFTSGSTGQPKGVMIDHRGAANTLQDINARFGIGPADRVLALSSLSFDLSVFDVFGTLAAGGTLIVPAPERSHDPAHWTELIEKHHVTVWNSVPALMQVWLDAPGTAPALRVVMLSGDWIPVHLPAAIRARCPQAAVHSLGGATEASIWSIGYPIGEVDPAWVSIPYGKPLANQSMHVLDDALSPSPVWTTGEIYIGGTGVALGYWADPVRTGERFVQHPRTGERLYRTGDLGRYRPGADIEFLGRADSQVKLNGYRIELGEIAAVLRRQPDVADALVVVATSPDTGRRQLVGYVIPSAGAAPSAAALRAELTGLLPDYMVPQHYAVIERLPLSANGKVDLAALPTPWTDSGPTERVPPSDELEGRLLAIWQQTLGLEEIGVTDNLFELGGDSLHAVRILGRIRDDFGIDGDGEEGLRWIFDSPTIAELAASMRTAAPA